MVHDAIKKEVTEGLAGPTEAGVITRVGSMIEDMESLVDYLSSYAERQRELQAESQAEAQAHIITEFESDMQEETNPPMPPTKMEEIIVQEAAKVATIRATTLKARKNMVVWFAIPAAVAVAVLLAITVYYISVTDSNYRDLEAYKNCNNALVIWGVSGRIIEVDLADCNQDIQKAVRSSIP